MWLVRALPCARHRCLTGNISEHLCLQRNMGTEHTHTCSISKMTWTNLQKPLAFIIIVFCVICIHFYYKQETILTSLLWTEKSPSVSSERAWSGSESESRGSCACQPGSVQLKDKFPVDQHDEVSHRRKEELEKYKKRTKSELSNLLLAKPNSPLQYPIQGVTVAPLRSSLIPGLALETGERSSYKVTLKVSKGVLSSDDSHTDVTVAGKEHPELTLVSSSLERLNDVLKTISYKSIIYHVNTADFASFYFENHEATFPIVIKQPQPPVMFDMGTDINSQVTVTVKTFLRYNNLEVLLSSIRKFYPKITVIIADDSFEPKKIPGENIQQYLMPPAQGWFAGRNLAVSQVATKYFLWADDDFAFTEDTKIEKLLKVMEDNPELDVVGGSVQGNQFYFSLEYDEGNETEGGCLYRKSNGRFHTLPGYPKCFLVSGVVNFFLARTDSMQKSRFDPLLKRVAHSEWFMDGLGSLMVASCSDVSIQHQSHTNSALYNKYRSPSDASDTTLKYQMHFFKNNLKCIKFG